MGTHPADLVFVPTSACWTARSAGRHYCVSPGSADIGSTGGAGLTPKPHRARATRSRLTWAVSPATGIGLPDGTPWRRPRGAPPDATTDPDGCHEPTLAQAQRPVEHRRGDATSTRPPGGGRDNGCSRHLDTRLPQRAGGLDQGRAGRDDVVDEDHPAATRVDDRTRCLTTRAPARLALRSSAVRPAWSATRRRCVSRDATRSVPSSPGVAPRTPLAPSGATGHDPAPAPSPGVKGQEPAAGREHENRGAGHRPVPPSARRARPRPVRSPAAPRARAGHALCARRRGCAPPVRSWRQRRPPAGQAAQGSATPGCRCRAASWRIGDRANDPAPRTRGRPAVAPGREARRPWSARQQPASSQAQVWALLPPSARTRCGQPAVDGRADGHALWMPAEVILGRRGTDRWRAGPTRSRGSDRVLPSLADASTSWLGAAVTDTMPGLETDDDAIGPRARTDAPARSMISGCSAPPGDTRPSTSSRSAEIQATSAVSGRTVLTGRNPDSTSRPSPRSTRPR